jgi:hypothetical protein
MHERAVHVALGHQVPEDIHHLGVKDGGRFKVLSGGCRAGEDEDAGADDGANSESGQRPGTKRLL